MGRFGGLGARELWHVTVSMFWPMDGCIFQSLDARQPCAYAPDELLQALLKAFAACSIDVGIEGGPGQNGSHETLRASLEFSMQRDS